MNKANKLISVFALYWQLSLDTVLTHVFVITFLITGFPAIAAFLMSIDALFKITLSVLMSRITLSIPPSIRGKVSATLKFSLIIIWFISVSQLSINKNSSGVFIPFILFKILLLLDSFVSAEFIFGLKQYFQVDLGQSTAAQNILIRASTFMAPALALIILKAPHASLVIFITAIIIYFSSILFLKRIFISSPDNQIKVSTVPLGFSALMVNPYMRWGFAYQIVANLAFAGVSFILLKELKPHGDLFFNEITLLYLGFLLIQMIVLIYGEDVIPINKVSQITFSMGMCATSVMIAALARSSLWHLTACFVIGLTYSCTLTGTQKVVTAQLRGPGYIEYVGWAQMAGRFSSFTSTMILGFAFSFGFSPSVLLAICGLLGLFSSSWLTFFQMKIMNPSYTLPNPLKF